MEFGLAILFGIGVAWMYLTTPEQRQMIFGYIIFFTDIMSIIAFFTGQGPCSAYGPYYSAPGEIRFANCSFIF